MDKLDDKIKLKLKLDLNSLNQPLEQYQKYEIIRYHHINDDHDTKKINLSNEKLIDEEIK